jgi:SAM-dependent methyltransferase
MATEGFQWENFYQKNQGRAVRPILLDARERFDAAPFLPARKAIDLGCGDGTESVTLLGRGWQVLAIDAEPEAISRLNAKIPPELQGRVQAQVAKFEDVVLTPADLVFASYSIPFCRPESFDDLWQKINRAIVAGGRFTGQFFGVRDTWASNPKMTFHTEEQVHAMLEGFAIEYFHEEDQDGESTAGPKHWHVFSVIAQRR